jgi:hypothetical protein
MYVCMCVHILTYIVTHTHTPSMPGEEKSGMAGTGLSILIDFIHKHIHTCTFANTLTHILHIHTYIHNFMRIHAYIVTHTNTHLISAR